MTDSPGNGYLVNSGYKSTGPSTNSLETWRSNTSNQYQAGAPKQPNVGAPRPEAFDAGAAGSWEFPHATPTGASTGAAQGNSAVDQNLADSQDAAASAARSGLDSVRQMSRGFGPGDQPARGADALTEADSWEREANADRMG
jgi:hypothetical protein